MAAGGIEPWHADAVAFFHGRHAGAKLDDDADGFVPWNEGDRWFHWPVAFCGVQIRMADAAGFGFDQYLAGPRNRDRPFLHGERLAEFHHHGGVHCFGLRGFCSDVHFRFPLIYAAALPRPRTASIIFDRLAAASPYTMLQFGL